MRCPTCNNETWFDVVECSKCGWQAPTTGAPPPGAVPLAPRYDPAQQPVAPPAEGGGGDIAIGVVLLVLGVGITAASTSGGGGRVFYGLMVVGVWRIIKGLMK